MTNEDKIKVLAEMGGWKFHPDGVGHYQGELKFWTASKPLPPYLTSYDAIIPLIQTQDGEIRMLVCDYCLNVLGFGCYFDATPEQLSDALIKAVGKWKE